METKTKKIIGIITGVSVLGIAVCSIKKYYDSKKQEEQAIDLEEAKRIVKDDISNIELTSDQMEDVKFGARDSAHYEPTPNGLSDEQMSEVINEARDVANFNASFYTGPIGVKREDLQAAATEEVVEEEEAWWEGVDPQEIQNSKGYFEQDKGEIETLRYEPNSAEAREQFINMELAILGRDNDARDIVGMLYDFPFVPTCDEDQNLKTRLIDHRIKFFGFQSKWAQQVTFGDLIMYYGKAAEFNCGNDAHYWVDYFLGCANMNDITITSEEIEERINLMNKHNFYNDDTQSFGLFGLSAAQMTEACSVARARIDECVTYDIEFNQFQNGIIQ